MLRERLGNWISLPGLWCAAALVIYFQSAALGARQGAQPARAAVTIENYAFEPDPITVRPGTTVVWTNRDEVAHNVVSRDGLFTSPDLEANGRFEYTFKKAGTFDYFCSIHPEMKGRVIVK